MAGKRLKEEEKICFLVLSRWVGGLMMLIYLENLNAILPGARDLTRGAC